MLRCEAMAMANSSLFALIILFLMIPIGHSNEEAPKVHIVYMGGGGGGGGKPEQLTTAIHHDTLSSVLGSREAAAESMIYSYRHGFSGFAAKLTKSQAQRISDHQGVVQVIQNQIYKPQTTRSWDYLQLSAHSPPSNLLHQTHMGEGVIIGILDTGIWPESQAFSDKYMGKIPSRWKGRCEAGTLFDPATACNRKLIGAKYFIKGLEAEVGVNLSNDTEFLKAEFLSPRDTIGHGTHIASIAGASFTPNVSYRGLGRGTLRGGAPLAHLAMYKVCWRYRVPCTYADIIKAIDEAIHDGVDVLSLSLAAGLPQFWDLDVRCGVGFGAFHAVANGITVVSAGSNAGPVPQTVENTAPWIITVAASTIDRSFSTFLTLGNNQTILGESLFTGNKTGFHSLVFPESTYPTIYSDFNTLTPNDTSMTGKIVLLFHLSGETAGEIALNIGIMKATAMAVGARGLVVAKNPTKTLSDFISEDFPIMRVSFDAGVQILNYIRYSKNPIAQLSPTRTHVGQPVSARIASFSSRGPNPLVPSILKPDIAAPGANILAAYKSGSPYGFLCGTSLATPHVAAIAALLKSLHPKWSPAAIKSAIVTTAWTTDPHSGEEIIAEGDPNKYADPFDYGGGLLNANRAKDPGLVYDISTSDYILQYLCVIGNRNSTTINQLTGNRVSCPTKKKKKTSPILDLNLPSITIPSLRDSVTVRRTVTNVGPVKSKYRAEIEAPRGVTLKVKPDTLSFDSTTKKRSFTVTVTTQYKYATDYYNFGSLTWTDGVHRVRSPVSVKTEFPEDFYR